VVYARVCSPDQRADFDRQVARVAGWLTGQGLTVTGEAREAGSRLNGRRPKLRRVPSDLRATVIVVEHRGRLDGRRGARNWAVRAVTAAKNADMDAAA
jgi:predicted site-specific integrase-resolvase